MDGFGFRWMTFFGLRLNCKKYDGEAKNWGGGGVKGDFESSYSRWYFNYVRGAG